MKVTIKDKGFQNAIKIYLILIIGFYPVAYKYKEMDSGRQIGFGVMLVALIAGFFFNIGPILLLFERSRPWKKIILALLLVSAFTSASIFHLQMFSSSFEPERTVKSAISCFILIFLFITSYLLVKYKHE